MPIPTPKKDEKEDGYITRCMGDETMKTEFKDNKQRYAVCKQTFDHKDKKKDDPKK